MNLKIKRRAPGSYQIGLGGLDPEMHYIVMVSYLPHLRGWIAAAVWDRYLYSDPQPTYRDAKKSAEYQLRTAAQEEALKHADRH